MTFPHWLLTPEEIDLAAKKGWEYVVVKERFRLHHPGLAAMIWPHIDGFMSIFIRQGHYVKHKKFKDLGRALDRRFGDSDEKT